MQEYIDQNYDALNVTPNDERLATIYIQIQNLYLFDHYKYIAIIYNSEDESSYAFEKNYYDRLFLSNFNMVTNDLLFSYALETNDNHQQMVFNINEPDKDGDETLVATAIVSLPVNNPAAAMHKISFLGDSILETTLVIPFNDGYPVYLTLFLFPQYDRAFLFILLSALMVAALIGMIIIALFSKHLTKRALIPLSELSEKANAIDFNSPASRIEPTGSKDEIDSLIKNLNFMLDNIESVFDNQRRFISDASHELRIPLTVMKGYVELIEKTGLSDVSLLDEGIRNIGSEVDSMQSLVESLLLLARADSHRMTVRPKLFTAADIFEQITNESKQLYPDFTIIVETPPDVKLYADYTLTLHVLCALVDNGYKYAKASRQIRLKAFEISGHMTTLAVCDDGPGIPEHAITKLTERFYRIDHDQNRDTGGF